MANDQTTAELLAKIAADLATNGTNSITAADLRGVLDDIAQSSLNRNSDTADNIADGTTNTFLEIGTGTDSLKSHDATGAYLEGDIAIGKGAIAGVNGGTATDFKNIAIGLGATAFGRFSTAMGNAAQAEGANATAYGETAVVQGTKATALGSDTTVTADNAVGIGGATVSGTASVGLGASVTVSSDDSFGFRNGSVSHDDCIVWGGTTVNSSSDTNQFIVGSRTLLLGQIGNGNVSQLPTASVNDYGMLYTFDGKGSGRPAISVSNGTTWRHIPLDAASLAGDTFIGQVEFSGTNHSGIRLISLTTTERNALTPATGMLIFNETTSNIEGYDGTSWVDLTASGTGGSISVEEEGTEVVASVERINFVGTGVTATDAGSGEVTVTIAGGAAPVDSVNSQTGAVVLDADDIDDSATTHKFASAAQLSAIDGLGSLASLNTVDTAQIDDAAVTLAKMANITTDSFIGRTTASTGVPEVLSAGDARTILNVADGATANTGALADLDTVDTAQIANEAINEAKLSATNAPTDNQILSYDEASGGFTWVNDATGSGSGAIDDLTDVVITTPVDNEVLAYDNGTGDWINQTAAEAGLAAAGHTHAAADIVGGQFADARISQSSVTQYQGALTITEGQISDLGSYITAASTSTLTNKTFDANGAGNSITNIETADLASAAKTGSDTKVVTGTEGTSGNLAMWNADGDAVDSTVVADEVVVSDPAAVTGADAVTNMMSLTQAEYDAITPDASTLYIITDAA